MMMDVIPKSIPFRTVLGISYMRSSLYIFSAINSQSIPYAPESPGAYSRVSTHLYFYCQHCTIAQLHTGERVFSRAKRGSRFFQMNWQSVDALFSRPRPPSPLSPSPCCRFISLFYAVSFPQFRKGWSGRCGGGEARTWGIEKSKGA